MCDNDECRFNCFGICLFVVLCVDGSIKPCEEDSSESN